MYEYRARLMRVVDGDTIDMTVDLGFRIHREIRLRLKGIDTHETYGVRADTEEYERGMEEKQFVVNWLEAGATPKSEWPYRIRTRKAGKFGRYLAEVERETDNAVLNDDLLEEYGEEIRY